VPPIFLPWVASVIPTLMYWFYLELSLHHNKKTIMFITINKPVEEVGKFHAFFSMVRRESQEVCCD
jgi:hypothetical protein